MKRLSLLLLAALLFAGAKVSALDVFIVCSKAENILDQWLNILPGRPPHLPMCDSVVKAEPFSVNVFFAQPEIKGGMVNVSGKIELRNPSGELRFEAKMKPQIFPCENNKSVFMFQDFIKADFDPPDALGEYTFRAEVKDENSGKTVIAEAKITLKGSCTNTPDENLTNVLMYYYSKPAPQNILPGFKEFLSMIPEMKQKQGHNFNPLSMLALFHYLLRSNPQLHQEFADMVNAQSPEGQTYGAIIVHELGEPAFALLSESARASWNPALAGTFKVEQVEQLWHLDILWSEFFATGKKDPIEKIVGQIKNLQGNISIEEFKKLQQPSEQDRQSLMRYLRGMAALWAVSANARQHRLVDFYLEAMLVRNEIEDELTCKLIAAKLKEIAEKKVSGK